jgi:hypothetical protein
VTAIRSTNWQNNATIDCQFRQKHYLVKIGGVEMKRICLFLFVFLLMITGCGTETDLGTKDNESDKRSDSTVDYISFGDKQYVNAWELSLEDTAKIEKIGEVERGSRISAGTAVYEIVGYPERDVIAVKDSDGPGLLVNRTGYSIYVLNEGSDHPSHYPNILDLQVEKINIYKGVTLLRTLEGEDVRTFLSLLDKHGPYNEFQGLDSKFSALLITDNTLGYNYGILEKDGEFGLAHIESKLPTKISQFFTE